MKKMRILPRAVLCVFACVRFSKYAVIILIIRINCPVFIVDTTFVCYEVGIPYRNTM
jgi:hypothetical protein